MERTNRYYEDVSLASTKCKLQTNLIRIGDAMSWMANLKHQLVCRVCKNVCGICFQLFPLSLQNFTSKFGGAGHLHLVACALFKIKTAVPKGFSIIK